MAKSRHEVARYLDGRAHDTLDSGGLLQTLKNALEVEGTWRDVLKRLAALIDEPYAERPADGTPTYWWRCHRDAHGNLIADVIDVPLLESNPYPGSLRAKLAEEGERSHEEQHMQLEELKEMSNGEE